MVQPQPDFKKMAIELVSHLVARKLHGLDALEYVEGYIQRATTTGYFIRVAEQYDQKVGDSCPFGLTIADMMTKPEVPACCMSPAVIAKPSQASSVKATRAPRSTTTFQGVAR